MEDMTLHWSCSPIAPPFLLPMCYVDQFRSKRFSFPVPSGYGIAYVPSYVVEAATFDLFKIDLNM